jgi:phosphatase NudJ
MVYIRVSVVAGCILRQGDKYLLVQQKQERAYGLWDLPAGHVDKGETIEQAALREVAEETGYYVRIIKKVGIYQESPERAVKHVFFAEITGGELTVDQHELLGARWLSYPEIEQLHSSGQLRRPFVWESIQSLHSSN